MAIKGNQIIYSPSQLYQVGKHEITLIITDILDFSANKTFYITVFQPPKFVGSLPKLITIQASNPASYILPLQGNSDEYITHSGLPSFASFETQTYQFLPNKVTDLGISLISGQLFNKYTSISFSLKVNVTNEAPQFSAKLVNQIMAINTKLSYFTPEVFDREGQTIRFSPHEVGQPSLPFFVKFLPPTREFQFSPTQVDQQKAYQLQLDIIDSFGATSSATFTITLQDAVSQSQQANQEQSQSTLSPTQGSQSSTTSSGSTTISISTLNKKQQSEIETQILGLEILKVTRDQKATIKINNPSATAGQKTTSISDIMLQMSNQTFGAYVLQSSGSYKIRLYIIEKDLTNYLIQVNLKYPNPSNLSTSQTPDKLKVSTLNRMQVIKNKILTILPEHSSSEATIPSQITQSYEAALVAISQGGRIAFTEDTSSNLIIGFIIQIIWIQFEDISFMVINSLVQISIPGLPSTIQSFLMKYIFFDILYTELWVSKFMNGIGIDFDNVKNDTAINVQFSDNGFDSKQFLKNSGSSFFFLLIYVVFWLVLLLLSILSRHSIKIHSIKQKLQKFLMWKISLNLLMNQFPILLQCCLINFYDMRLSDDQVLAKLSSIISILVFIALLTALIMIFWKVFQVTKNLNHILLTDYIENYSVMTESLKETKVQKIIFFWKPLYLVRWTLTIMILTMIQEHPSFQILCLLGLSLVWQYLILKARPYQSRAVNIITFVNEAAVSIYLYLAFMLSDYLDSQVIDNQPLLSYLKLQIAWFLTCLLLLTILINFLFTLVNLITAVFRYIKSKVKCKRKIEIRLEQQKQSLPQDKYNDDALSKEIKDSSPHVDVTAFADFSKLGYESYEYYPGAYAFTKIQEEVKSEQPFEKINSEFNFYEHI